MFFVIKNLNFLAVCCLIFPCCYNVDGSSIRMWIFRLTVARKSKKIACLSPCTTREIYYVPILYFFM